VAQQMNKIQIVSLSNLTLAHQFIPRMAMMKPSLSNPQLAQTLLTHR
jgi:hypothetical protein